MSSLHRRACVGLVVALLWQPLLAQRMVGGGLNYSPKPAVYDVVAIDRDERKVRLRAADGRWGDVFVDESVFDVAKLKVGDKIRVDFVAPDQSDKGLRAAQVWLEK